MMGFLSGERPHQFIIISCSIPCCISVPHHDDSSSAYQIRMGSSLFASWAIWKICGVQITPHSLSWAFIFKHELSHSFVVCKPSSFLPALVISLLSLIMFFTSLFSCAHFSQTKMAPKGQRAASIGGSGDPAGCAVE